MTAAISAQNASIFVRNIWESLTKETPIEHGKLQFEGGEAAIRQVVKNTRDALKGSNFIAKDATDIDVLKSLEQLFTKTLEARPNYKDKTAKAAVTGLADILKTAGTLSNVSSLSDEALNISKTVNRTLLQGTFRGWINKFKEKIADELRQAGQLPKEYRDALHYAQKKIDGNPSPVAVRTIALNLQNIANNASARPSIMKRFLEAFLNFLETFIDEEKAIHLDFQMKDLLKRIDANKEINPKELRKLSASSYSLDKKRLISHGLFLKLQIEQAKSFYISGKQKDAIKILLSMQGHFSAAIRDQINRLAKEPTLEAFNKICADLKTEISRVAQPFDYLRAIEIMSRSRKKKSDRIKLTKGEQEYISDFLTYARANKDLNEYLVNIEPRTPVEESLCAYTWITLQQKQDCKYEADNINKFLEKSHLDEFSNICQLYKTEKKREKDVPFVDDNCLDGIFCERQKGDELHYEGQFVFALEAVIGQKFLHTGKTEKKQLDPNFKELQTLFTQMKFISAYPKRQEQFSPDHLEAAQQMQKKLTALSKDPKYEKIHDKVQTALTQITSYNAFLQKGLRLKKQIEEAASRATAELPPGADPHQDPLSARLKELHTLEQFSLFNGLFEILPEDIKVDAPVYDLYENSDAAAKAVRKLNSLLQLLPSYLPGDVGMEDEVMKKGFQGKKASQMYSLQKSSFPPSGLMHDLATKGLFAVQPFFTGSRTHASIVATLPDEEGAASLHRQEIVSDFEQDLVGFFGSLTSTTFRANWEKLLTANGKQAVAQLQNKDKTFSLERLFSSELNSYMKSHQEEFKTYKNDCYKAADAYVQKLPWLARKVLHFLKNKLVPEEPLSPEEQKQLDNTSKIFCSEFISIVIKEVQKKVEENLQRQLKAHGIKENGPLLLEQITAKPESIDPNSLEKILLPFYQEQPAPVITRLLLGNDFGRKAIEAHVK